MISDLLHHRDTPSPMGPDGTHPRGLRELVEVPTEPLPIIYHHSWLTGRSQGTGGYPVGHWVAGQSHHPDLSAGEHHGADHFQCHHTAYPGHQDQPAGIRQALND